MRQGGGPNNNRRPRNRHHSGGGDRSNHHSGGNGGGNNSMPRSSGGGGDNRPRSASSLRHQTFDSNCTDVRVRGNAWQVHEKYQALARDAQGSGDRVAAENYLQHAEHYYRIIEAINEATALEQRQRGGPAGTPGAPGAPQQFGQQPEVPTNYYGSAGNPTPPPPPGNPNAPQQNPNGEEASGNVAAAPGAPQAEAEVQQKRPPVSPFFTPEETEEQQNGLEPLAVRR